MKKCFPMERSSGEKNSGKKTAGEQSFCGVFPDVTLINDALSKDNGERSYIFTIALKTLKLDNIAILCTN